ncbi:DUF4231 domain-containing protein [Vibrio lentus]|uniref:DUF4231 domain-containing protein n=1 Tax=Vibrio lentus TaxID=136468 RepID=UPI002469925D|nr:DUF4231 domain-containing protein [Vibrio lentus]MDH5925057.1 DUF4231 domain-containing protein [Vibrio lentus]
MEENIPSPVEYCQQQINHFKEKASHNKNEALWCFRIIMAGTLLAPVFVTLGVELWTAKVIPSLLSVLAAFCTAWIQLRKPQSLWPLYRTAQRELENHLTKYRYKIEDYGDSDTADQLLAQNVAELSFSIHNKWIPIVPSPDRLSPDTTTIPKD